jgi:hypothetical protein
LPFSAQQTPSKSDFDNECGHQEPIRPETPDGAHMSKQQATRQRATEDPQASRWRGIGIAAVAAAKSVKPAAKQPCQRDATVQRLIDSNSER